MQKIESPIKNNGYYSTFLIFVEDESNLIKSKFLRGKRLISTNEKVKSGNIRYYDLDVKDELLRLYNANDFESILKLPTTDWAFNAPYIICNFTESGSFVSFGIDGKIDDDSDKDSVGLAPVKIFLEEEGSKYLQYAKRI